MKKSKKNKILNKDLELEIKELQEELKLKEGKTEEVLIDNFNNLNSKSVELIELKDKVSNLEKSIQSHLDAIVSQEDKHVNEKENLESLANDLNQKILKLEKDKSALTKENEYLKSEIDYYKKEQQKWIDFIRKQKED